MPLPDPKYSNSAGRLLNVLGNFQQSKSVTSQGVKLFFDEIPANNDQQKKVTLGFKVIEELHTLYSSFIHDMENVDISNEQRAVLLNGLKTLPRCIYHSNIDAVIPILSDAEKSLLEVCATFLPTEGVLSKDDLKKIQGSIQELQEQINNSETDPELKIILQELIRLSHDSINRFNIYGATGLKKAFKSMLAEVAEMYLMSNEEQKENLRSSESWALINKHLKIFDGIAAKVLQYSPALDNIGKLFLE